MDNKPVRIAHVVGKLVGGGIESVVYNYYQAIDKTKYQFDFIYDDDSSCNPPDELIELGARFIKIPRYQNLLAYSLTLTALFNKEQYQIVHSHINTLSVFPLFSAWLAGVPIRIAHNHSVPGGNEKGRNALKNILRHFSKLFASDYCACSEDAARWIFGDRVFDENRVTIIKNAIDFSKFIIIDKEIVYAKEKELSIPEDAFVLGHVGRFTYAKNHQKVISIFESIEKKIPNAVLLLIGDGEEHENIVNRINKDGIEDKVFFTGIVEDVNNYYPVMDVLVLPSVFEGVPVTAIESQIAGVPCVLSDIINKEVCISDSCAFVNVNESDNIWSEKALSMIGKKVVLNESSSVYRIENAVKVLENKYNELLLRL